MSRAWALIERVNAPDVDKHGWTQHDQHPYAAEFAAAKAARQVGER